MLSCPYLVTERQFCQKYNILWVKRVNSKPFFLDFSRKNKCSHVHMLSTNIQFLKNAAFMPTFCQQKKTFILSKTLCSKVFFFSNFLMKTPLLSCPYVVKKRKLCQNYNICSRKVNRMPFFPICNKKPSALMPIL